MVIRAHDEAPLQGDNPNSGSDSFHSYLSNQSGNQHYQFDSILHSRLRFRDDSPFFIDRPSQPKLVRAPQFIHQPKVVKEIKYKVLDKPLEPIKTKKVHIVVASVLNDSSTDAEDPYLAFSLLSPEIAMSGKATFPKTMRFKYDFDSLAFIEPFEFESNPTEEQLIHLMFTKILRRVSEVRRGESSEFVIGFAFENGGFYPADDNLTEFRPISHAGDYLEGAFTASSKGTKVFNLTKFPTKMGFTTWDEIHFAGPKGEPL